MGKTDDLLNEYKSIKDRMMGLGNTGSEWDFWEIVSSNEGLKEIACGDHHADDGLSDQAKEELTKTLAREGYKPTVMRYELEAFVKELDKARLKRAVDITVVNRCKRANEKWRDYTKRPDKSDAPTCEFMPGNHRGYEHEDRYETEMAMFELGIKKGQDELTPAEWEKIADWKFRFHKLDIKSGPYCNEWEEINDPWHRPCKSKKNKSYDYGRH